jgi:haloalkane dehalogenase
LIEFVRTPEKRFENLPDYPFEANYVDINGLRLHYIDEGPADADPILMLHGEPTWSYLYRHMISICAAAGHRVIAPDLIGFGKSDKPVNQGDYSYQQHMDWLQGFIDKLNLNNVTLVCQDWGSLLGLRLAAENESRFKAIVLGNGMLLKGDEGTSLFFKAWRTFARFSPWFPVARIVEQFSYKSFSKDERRAYNAPFPSKKHKAGPRVFPSLIPTTTDNPASAANRDAWKILEQWQKPFLTTFSDGEPVFKRFATQLQETIPGAKGQPHVTLRGGHFLQEDSGPEFAEQVNKLLARMQ